MDAISLIKRLRTAINLKELAWQDLAEEAAARIASLEIQLTQWKEWGTEASGRMAFVMVNPLAAQHPGFLAMTRKQHIDKRPDILNREAASDVTPSAE